MLGFVFLAQVIFAIYWVSGRNLRGAGFSASEKIAGNHEQKPRSLCSKPVMACYDYLFVNYEIFLLNNKMLEPKLSTPTMSIAIRAYSIFCHTKPLIIRD